MLTRFVRIQLVIFTIASVVGVSVLLFNYIQVQRFLGIGRINVTLDLPATGGLYRFSNVTYRGVQVGQVTNVDLTRTGVKNATRAVLTLDTSEKIPADLEAHVRSVSAIGEQYVDLVPRTDAPPYLADGSVIDLRDTTIPQPVGPMLDQVSGLLGSIPKDRVHNLLDESYKALNGADYDLQSLFDSTAKLAGDLNGVGDQSRALMQDSAPLLDTQTQSDDAIRTWTHALAGVTDQFVTNDPQFRTILQKGPGSLNEASRLLDQLKPTIPVLLANLTTIGQVAVTYRPALEQMLVLLPPVISMIQAIQPNRNAAGLGLGAFRLSIADPPTCTVGFLPPSSWRSPYETTTVDTPDDLYCKLPQDSPIAVRGTRNLPCLSKPGKRAPTVALCDSDQEFEPIAQKQPIVGPNPRDPNLEAQGVPPDARWFPDQGLYAPPGEGPPAPATQPPTPPTQVLVPPPVVDADIPPPGPDVPTPAPDPNNPMPVAPSSFQPGGSASAPPLLTARYNPRTGEYVGPDGQTYKQSDLVPPATPRTWKDLVFSG
jgi:phospholipid/cholesterol/gamma-HCH transport system substrate-binding protein